MRLPAFSALLIVGLTACAVKYQSVAREYLPSTAAAVFPANESVTQPIRSQLDALHVAQLGSEASRNLLKELDFGNVNETLSVDDKRRVNGHWLQFYDVQDSKNGRKPGSASTCISISGGGIRSAAFALGVLEGLEEKMPLSSIRAISATSGGAYAMTALYAAASRSNAPLSAHFVGTDSELMRITRDPSFLPDSLRIPLMVRVAAGALNSVGKLKPAKKAKA